MSLLMDALKKAEKAKQKAEEVSSVQSCAQGNIATSPLTTSLTTDYDKRYFQESMVEADLNKLQAEKERPVAKESKDAQQRSNGISLEARPDLDNKTQSPPQKTEKLSLQDPYIAPVSAPAMASSEQQQSDQQVRDSYSGNSARGNNKSSRNIIIGSGLGLFFLISIGAFLYYQSISSALQKNISDAVSPILKQQAQKKLKTVSVAAEDSKIQDGKINRLSTKRVIQSVQSVPKPLVKKPLVSVAKKSAVVKKVKKKPKKVLSVANVSVSEQSINIKRQFIENNIYQLLVRAYQAYQVGNDAEAVAYYSKVLAREKNNRDALLGLAAISVRTNQYEKARDTYIAILENNPKDSVALSGLLNIQSNVDPVKSETQIKLLLDREPRSSHLLFTLGSLYASQQRWAEAQKVFFKSYSSDNKNADFAYNLAVSLDQLEQRRAALKYYRVALELVKRQPISFKVKDVMQRILVLQQVAGG